MFKHDSKKSIFKTSIIIIIIIAAAFAAGSATYAYIQFSKMKTTKIDKTDSALGITPNEAAPSVTPSPSKTDNAEISHTNKVINIALFGIDTGRLKYEAQHSDAIMILSIDKEHKSIKLSSIIRDSYVPIEGHDKTKINSAYVYGGPQLAIKTLNRNFDLDIRDYITVNFFGLEKIINVLGGVEADVKHEEIDEINKYIKEVANLEHKKYTPIKKSGRQILNGSQAVAYARIRKVGNGDFDRTERQSTVLIGLMKKVQKYGVSKYPQIALNLMPCVETSLSKMDVLKLGAEILSSGISNIDWHRFPSDGYYKPAIINKKWCLTFDRDITKNQIQDFIYKNKKPASQLKK